MIGRQQAVGLVCKEMTMRSFLKQLPYGFPSSAGNPGRNASIKLSCASKTNSIVKKFLMELYELKHHQLQRRNKSSSTTRKSSVRKNRERSVGSKSCSPPPFSIAAPTHTSFQPLHHISHCGAPANLGSIKDGAALGELVVGEKVPKHEVVEQLISVPETGELCLTPLHTEPASTQGSVKGTRSPKSSYFEAGGNSGPICEVLEHRQLGKPKKAVILSGLLIQARGPDQSLLCRRIPARGPDPSLRRGPNPSLVHGPNPALLRKNQP
ncbi:hypothetical protein TSMEX_002073 [Taenia solium]|eukprot:TsM_000198400 transcript=TsM_000198400 gene=TsM_000198400